ncbi:hypothetical protein GCM10029992_13360 [Glycomyces albus]
MGGVSVSDGADSDLGTPDGSDDSDDIAAGSSSDSAPATSTRAVTVIRTVQATAANRSGFREGRGGAGSIPVGRGCVDPTWGIGAACGFPGGNGWYGGCSCWYGRGDGPSRP